MKTGLLLISFLSGFAFCQNVGINTATPDPSAMLDVQATDKGLLPPRLTTLQRDAVSSPARGLMIYNTDTDCMEYWNGTQWISMCATTAPCVTPPRPAVSYTPSPACEGQTVTLNASTIPGATYVWTGPNSFYDTNEDPVINNIQLVDSGAYTCRVFLGGCWSEDTTVQISVLDDRWEQLANYGSATLRTVPSGFQIGDTIYVGTGRVACGTELADMWAYDVSSDTWMQIADVPSGTGHAKNGMTGFALAGLGYIGGGNHSCGFTYKSFYRYNPADGSWTTSGTVANFPNDFSDSFNNGMFGGEGYVGFGHCGSANGEGSANCSVSCQDRDVFSYNPGTNTWTNRGQPPYVAPNGNMQAMAAMDIGGRFYIGLGAKASYSCSGARTSDEWFEYTGGTTWVARSSFPGVAGKPNGYYTVGNLGYIIDSANNHYQYDPATDAWTQLSCPYPGSGSSRFYTIGYNGKGYMVDTSTGETWVYTP